MELNLGSIKLPVNAATKAFALLAKRGAGKTHTGAVMAEEFYKCGIPFVVFDPIDVWWGLKLSADGKDTGLERVVVFGREHADVPIERDMGKAIARAIVKDNVSCVISTFGMPKVAMRQLIADFAEEILNINDTPRHIFIEEAHEFVPQRVMGAMSKTFSAVEALVVMGRNRGLGVTLLNQRAATVNKDVLTQVDSLLAFQNTSPQDRKALKDWVEHHSADGDFEAFMKSLPSLPRGEGWIWSPEFMGIFERIKIRARTTFHPDREKLDKKFVMPELKTLDIPLFINTFKKEYGDTQDQPETGKKKKGKTDLLPTISDQGNTGSSVGHAMAHGFDIQQREASIRNEYESKAIEQEIKINSLTSQLNKAHSIISAISKLVGGNGGMTIEGVNVDTGQVEMWAKKLPGGPAKVLRFLNEKRGLNLSRSQVGLGTGLSKKSISLYLPVLKRNQLVLENNGQVYINPEI